MHAMNMQVTQLTAAHSSASVDATQVVTPRFLLRVGGLAVTRADALRCTQSASWHERILTLERLLARQKDRLVDILHEAVRTHREDQTARRRLLRLKRDIFNLRVARAQEARELALLLAEPEQALLHTWLDLWETYQLQLTLGPQILARELEQRRALLKELVSTEDFRKGVVLSSPVLDQAINGYLATDNLQLNREARTVERSLLEYLVRAVYKTSPFSTFTPVCIGTLAAGKAPDDYDIDLALASADKQSFTRLNMTILSRISTRVLACLPIRAALLVRVTNGWQLQHNQVRYVRRKPVLDALDQDTMLPLDLVQEHMIQLPLGALLRRLLELMGDGHEERLDALQARLCAQETYQGAETLVAEYFQHLLRLGFLIVPALQIDIHHERPLNAYCQQLRTIATPQTDALAARLSTIAALVDDYASAPVTARAGLLTHMRQVLQECGEALNAPLEALPGTLLYEDTTLMPRRLIIHRHNASWRPIFASLQQFQQLLPIFDSALPQKMMTRGYFLARYGAGQRCEDFFSFARQYKQEFLRLLQRDDLQVFDEQGAFSGRTDFFKQAEITQLNQARLQAARSIQHAYQALPTGSTELVLGDDFWQQLAPLVPSEVRELQSNSFFSHFARVNGEPTLILNRIYSGLTVMFSRFAYCFAHDERTAMEETLRSVLARLQPPGTVFAELKGGYDATNLNLHPAVTPYELVCPGELSTRPAAEQIPLEDLVIQDESASGQLILYSRRLAQRVIPLYLGFLIPGALPEMQQMLLNFSYLTMYAPDLWRGATGQELPDEDTPLLAYPRLRYHQIVLQRASWKVHPGILPRRESGQSDANFFLAVARWRKTHGLPERVFFTPIYTPGANNAPLSFKPLYVDFTSYFSVLLLEAAVKKTTTPFLITEMLPTPEQLWFKHNGQAYVSEFIFEVSHTRSENHDGDAHTLD